MSNYRLPSYIYIDTPSRWYDCLDVIQYEPQIAIDLESNGLYAYRESICLIQISTRNRDYIIDPKADLDWQPLGELIESPAVEKVLHASEYDLILMKKQHDWDLHNLFDTMWAVRILGHEKVGLANVLESYYDIHLNKKYQRTNWCERPLSPEQLAYAQNDTHFLLQLRDDLAYGLAQIDSTEEAAEIFAEQARVRIPNTDFHPDNFWSINGVYDLSPRERAVVRAINIYRDGEARRQDRPPFKIFGNKTILALAAAKPNHVNQMSHIPGLNSRQIRRYGWPLVRVIEQGLGAKPPQPPVRKRPPDKVANRYDRLQQWRKESARSRGVASDVIVHRETLWDIARHNPQNWQDLTQIASLGQWRLNTYGKDILNVLHPTS